MTPARKKFPRTILHVDITGEDAEFIDLRVTISPEVDSLDILDAIYNAVLGALSRTYDILSDAEEAETPPDWN